ncbi:P-loop containing nucleoside triphosphate hydrolase protein [Perkinsela sp. CCAP 1560/4]|nr:P-loop containing nucleoside triphosphate hydrolase protein [Perkinsela sp. CCAP 1560/4]|eukprot:KNH03645.1 P-loop containing nucleoside triphosphate hydrolase protein [Perkinsela sp. CCAP 1560/4]
MHAEASSEKDSTYKNLPWVEKYRPKSIDEVVGNREILSRLRIIAHQGNLPNLLLCGPPGTGKTSSLLCVAHELLGPGLKDKAFLELNASDERGIDVIRSKIKLFAQKKVTLPPMRHKIILLDEADSMTSAAQQALRRTMEIYSATTRFVLSCNASSKIIEPIQSRCAIVRFSKLENSEVLEKLKSICDQEAIIHLPDGEKTTTVDTLCYTNSGLEALTFIAEGDMRNAINGLQSTAAGFECVNAENVFKVCDQPSPATIESILLDAVKGNLTKAIEHLNEALLSKGYAAADIISNMTKVVQMRGDKIISKKTLANPKVDEERLVLEMLRVLAEAQIHMADGLATPLQLMGALAKLQIHCAL